MKASTNDWSGAWSPHGHTSTSVEPTAYTYGFDTKYRIVSLAELTFLCLAKIRGGSD